MSVCPSVCLSVKRMNCDKTKETSAKILTPYKRPIHLVCGQEKNGWWGMTSCTWNFRPNWPRSFKNVDFQSIFAHSASAVTPSKKVQLSLIGSHYVLSSEPKMNSVPYPKPLEGAQTCKTVVFCLKLQNKVCYRISLCESCQQQSCKAFICLFICAKNVWWGHPLLPENLAKTDPPLQKCQSLINIRS